MQVFHYRFYYQGENYPKIFMAPDQKDADKQWQAWLERNPRAIPLRPEVVKHINFELRGDMAQQFNESQETDPREEEEDFLEGY